MSDVTKVFITSEVADLLKITAPYLIRISKEMNFNKCDFREAGKRNYLFSENAVSILRERFYSSK